MKKIIITIFFFLFAIPCFAQSKILINEFLIDPQPQQVEIINMGTQEADISGWIIDDDGSPSEIYPILQNSIIYPNSCLVFSSNFYLNTKTPDVIRLIDNKNNLIDSFSYKSNSGSGITYQRLPNGENWATGSASLGFYNKTNVTCLATPTPTLIITPTITLIPTEGQTPTSIPISHDNIFISEAMVYPQSGNNEWIEIFNDNDYSVSLNNWFIDDIENGGSSPKSFSADIPEKGYYVFNLSSSMFNNSGDSVRLLDNNKNLKDSFEYSEGDQGKTFGRTSLDSDEFCQQEPSNSAVNNSCINSTTTTITSIKTGLINQTPTISPSNKLVSINQPARRNLDEGGLINTKKSIVPTVTIESGEVLGISNKLLADTSNNKSLINTLLFISFSYSLLTMVSILIKMKLIYEKTVRLLS